MNQLTINSIIQKNEDVVDAQIDDGTVMLDVESGHYYGLDAIATHIWQIIEQPQSVRHICDKLQAEYDVAEQQCQSDVIRFLNDMLDIDKVCIVATK
ncbi:PqqD family peptide modification chaperone [Aliikangiella maris]|uniref:PqqD family peptide modification chaperone n=2 Tax=Aliikangiella maris TaxID=3162458 RepID=A0ABV3MN65_9GAMM